MPARARRERMLRSLASRDALASRRAELSPAHWRSSYFIARCKALVGVSAIWMSTVDSSPGHLLRGRQVRACFALFPATLEKLVATPAAPREDNLPTFSWYFYRRHYALATTRKASPFGRRPFLFPPQPEAIAHFLISEAGLLFPRVETKFPLPFSHIATSLGAAEFSGETPACWQRSTAQGLESHQRGDPECP